MDGKTVSVVNGIGYGCKQLHFSKTTTTTANISEAVLQIIANAYASL